MPARAQIGPSAKAFLPASHSLKSLAAAARECRGCPLYLNATRTVFGEGERGSDILLVGEQPGDREDIAGRPFVGPAGMLLDTCLERAGIDRRRAYVTNAVKHFKWEPRGKRRIHKKPTMPEIAACRPWLDAEIATVAPRIVVCLGATAAQSLLGKDFRVTKQRGEIIRSQNRPPIVATVHPSSILRAPDDEARERETLDFISDLKKAAAYLS